jgi:N-acetylneuraminate synthase
MRINQFSINKETKPFIIAELSANHGGDIKRAKDSISMAARTGVSAVKIQSYTPDTMTINSELPDFVVKQGLWSGRTLYQLYSEAYTPFEWHEELFEHARRCGITLFSTPFDESAVDLLESLGTPAYKIASFEVVDLPLIKYVATKNKPILMSTGMASKSEIEEAVRVVRENSASDLLLFHCISSYPAVTEESNLNNLTWLAQTFDVEVGLSDHTTNDIAAVTAIGMGAVAIEKHFKLDNEILQ